MDVKQKICVDLVREIFRVMSAHSGFDWIVVASLIHPMTLKLSEISDPAFALYSQPRKASDSQRVSDSQLSLAHSRQ